MKRVQKRPQPASGVGVKSSNTLAALLVRIRRIWESAQTQAARSVNTAHVCANWMIGQEIVEAEQGGEKRAAYGETLLDSLSDRLSAHYGSGFSVSALKYMRLFYLEYPVLLENRHALRGELARTPGIRHAPRDELAVPAVPTAPITWQPGLLHSGLSWTHYRTLLKITRPEARAFYEIESLNNNWSARQLERQINSLLFERLAKSRDKKGVMTLANKGQTPERAQDLIKDPYVLEFLDLPESHRLTESRIEEALIGQLQAFLLELGSGFAFVGRQRRLTLDGDHFFPDLVFYHVKLKCYVVIDLKVGKLAHGDLGQMLLYVNYYDREVAAKNDSPTIGLILCSEKNDAVVRYVLADKTRQVFASRYQLHLPSEAELRAELQRELGRIEGIAEISPALTARKTRTLPNTRKAKRAKSQSVRARSRGKGAQK